MGNTNDSHHSSNHKQNDDIERDKHIPKRIIENKPTQNSNQNDNNPITSAAKSMFGGVKNYLFGSSKSQQHERTTHSKYRNSAVFVQLSAPNYYFANQV